MIDPNDIKRLEDLYNNSGDKIARSNSKDILAITYKITFKKTAYYLGLLTKIEEIAREAFRDPETQNITLYRAQKLADILAIFEYGGVPKEEG